VEYNCVLTKVDLLAACMYIALRVVGTVLVVFLWRWRKNLKFAQSSSQWEARADT
jgi:hypothetical protein